MINAQGSEIFFRWFIESTLGERGQMDEDAVTQAFSFPRLYQMIVDSLDLLMNKVNPGSTPKLAAKFEALKRFRDAFIKTSGYP